MKKQRLFYRSLLHTNAEQTKNKKVFYIREKKKERNQRKGNREKRRVLAV